MNKILSIVGARPNFIKAAPVTKALAIMGFNEVMVHTGQHYDANLSDNLFIELEIPKPSYNLGIGSGRQAWQLGEMIANIDEVIDIEKPNAVVVFGDTNSTAAGAIAAAKNYLPVAHVEAGLREFDKKIPEEVNKLLTTSITDLFFCPTLTGVKNLENIGIRENVHLVGDVGIDLIYNNLEKIENNKSTLKKFNVEPDRYYFFTCHRANNTDSREPLHSILEALRQLDLPVIFPMHPRTAKAIEQFGLPHPATFPLVQVVPPLGFFETQTLIRYAKMAITDSGGVVKEAYFHKTPGIIIDRQIEWLETIAEGWNRISGPDTQKILQYTREWQEPADHSNCLGNGIASTQIAKILKEYLDAKC
ncbi:MAG: UDP-N-acetylglucosamine 2-epimerase (non-hydrolyzing) [Bacteroidetes bacterium]|nr:UDP-N-acetylglucosamine 2-epimerase (non-hydrolyzing) [Bacteroidota bacterium]